MGLYQFSVLASLARRRTRPARSALPAVFCSMGVVSIRKPPWRSRRSRRCSRHPRERICGREPFSLDNPGRLPSARGVGALANSVGVRPAALLLLTLAGHSRALPPGEPGKSGATAVHDSSFSVSYHDYIPLISRLSPLISAYVRSFVDAPAQARPSRPETVRRSAFCGAQSACEPVRARAILTSSARENAATPRSPPLSGLLYPFGVVHGRAAVPGAREQRRSSASVATLAAGRHRRPPPLPPPAPPCSRLREYVFSFRRDYGHSTY